MIRRIQTVAVVLLALSIWAARPASAQVAPDDTGTVGVVGNGTATIERQPEILRLQLMLTADGKDVKDALAKLKEKEAAVKTKLAKLGATDASVSFADALPQEIDQRQQMEQMIQARTGRAPKAAKNAAPVVTLYTTLKAEWPLTSKTGDDLLVESQDIHDKIKAADLPGDKAKPATPEEAEVAEEAQGMNNGQPNPRDPSFMFVSKITDEDRDKAQAEAFKKASKDAERLAKAGGGQLGPIRLLTSHAAPSAYANPNYGYDGSYAYRQQMYANMASGEDDGPLEAVGMQAGKVSYRITVAVSFTLKN